MRKLRTAATAALILLNLAGAGLLWVIVLWAPLGAGSPGAHRPAVRARANSRAPAPQAVPAPMAAGKPERALHGPQAAQKKAPAGRLLCRPDSVV
jgi:hypothetical protein